MSMDLAGLGGHVKVGSGLWRETLLLAYDAGWEPAGTVLPMEQGPWRAELGLAVASPREGWNSGDYFSNSGQRVTATDAAALAQGLARAHNSASGWFGSRGGKKWLRKLIRFCVAGGFTLW